MKSICLVIETNSFGGAEIHTLSLIRLLLNKNYHIELITCRNNVYDEKIKLLNTDRVKLIRTDLRVNDIGMITRKKWADLFNKKNSDKLIFPKNGNNLGSIDFLMTCKRYFKKIYYIEHIEADPMPIKTSKIYMRGFIKGLGLWWYRERWLRKKRALFADRIIAVSAKVGERLIQDCGYPANKISVVPNGINWREFERKEESGSKFRQKYNIPFDTFVFGMIARLRRVKGIDIALEALHLLLKMQIRKPVFLVIAGEGKEENILRDIVINLRLEDKVIFMGFINRPQDVISAYDAILFPSRKEGLPLALLEGMAAGCLPIVSNVSGMPEVVNSPEIGWVIEPENTIALCNAMYNVLQLEESIIATMRRSIVNRIKENFDAEKSYQKILSILELD
jgi:glycosyltransferase involved in cell wall biosynthesis